MKRPTIYSPHGNRGRGLRADAVQQDDGNMLKGYVRLVSVDRHAPDKELEYLGSFETAKLLRFADTIRRRQAAWENKRRKRA